MLIFSHQQFAKSNLNCKSKFPRYPCANWLDILNLLILALLLTEFLRMDTFTLCYTYKESDHHPSLSFSPRMQPIHSCRHMKRCELIRQNIPPPPIPSAHQIASCYPALLENKELYSRCNLSAHVLLHRPTMCLHCLNFFVKVGGKSCCFALILYFIGGPDVCKDREQRDC